MTKHEWSEPDWRYSGLTRIRSATVASACICWATPVRQFADNLADCRVERFQLERLDQHRRLHSLEEKLYPRIILVTGKENEPLTSSRADPRHRPIEHLAPELRHHHVANDQIEGILQDLAETFDATRHRRYLKGAGNQVILQNFPEIIAIFQKQNPLAWPEHVLRRNLDGGHCRLSLVKIKGDGPLRGTVAEVRQ